MPAGDDLKRRSGVAFSLSKQTPSWLAKVGVSNRGWARESIAGLAMQETGLGETHSVAPWYIEVPAEQAAGREKTSARGGVRIKSRWGTPPPLASLVPLLVEENGTRGGGAGWG